MVMLRMEVGVKEVSELILSRSLIAEVATTS